MTVSEPAWSLGRVTAVARATDGSLRAGANPRGMQGATRSVASVQRVSDRRGRYSWATRSRFATRWPAGRVSSLLQLMASGEIPPPPIAQTLGFRLVEAERGHAVFECEPAEYHYNPIGVVHAGLAMTLMDSAMGLRVRDDRGTSRSDGRRC